MLRTSEYASLTFPKWWKATRVQDEGFCFHLEIYTFHRLFLLISIVLIKDIKLINQSFVTKSVRFEFVHGKKLINIQVLMGTMGNLSNSVDEFVIVCHKNNEAFQFQFNHGG